MTDIQSERPTEPIIFVREAIEREGMLYADIAVSTPWRFRDGPAWTSLSVENLHVFQRSETTGDIKVMEGPFVSLGSSNASARIQLPLRPEITDKLLTLTVIFVSSEDNSGTPIVERSMLSYRQGLFADRTVDLAAFMLHFESGGSQHARQALSELTPTVQAVSGFGPDPIVESSGHPDDRTFFDDNTLIQTQISERDQSTVYGPRPRRPRPEWQVSDYESDLASRGLSNALWHSLGVFLLSFIRFVWWLIQRFFLDGN